VYNTQTPTEIDPKLLESLGKVMPAVPPERPPHGMGKGGIIKELNPPKEYVFAPQMTPPGSK